MEGSRGFTDSFFELRGSRTHGSVLRGKLKTETGAASNCRCVLNGTGKQFAYCVAWPVSVVD